MIRPHEKLLIVLTAFGMLALARSAWADETISQSANNLIAASWPANSWLTSDTPQHGESSLEDRRRPLVADLYPDQHLIKPHAVPEPYGYLLAAMGLLGLLGMGTAVRRRRNTTSPTSGGEQTRTRHHNARSTHAKKRSLAHS